MITTQAEGCVSQLQDVDYFTIYVQCNLKNTTVWYSGDRVSGETRISSRKVMLCVLFSLIFLLPKK
jgi:hypothetical protein